MRVIPDAEKAVKWNTAFFGKKNGWFMAMYCYKKYVQLNFMEGRGLDPVPPVSSKSGNVRYVNIYEEVSPDVPLIESWIRQSLVLPGKELW